MMNMWKLSIKMSGHDEHVEALSQDVGAMMNMSKLSLSRCRAMMNMWKLSLEMSGRDEHVEALSLKMSGHDEHVEALSQTYVYDCGERPTMYHLMPPSPPPPLHVVIPTLVIVNCAKHWRDIICNSTYRVLDDEESSVPPVSTHRMLRANAIVG